MSAGEGTESHRFTRERMRLPARQSWGSARPPPAAAGRSQPAREGRSPGAAAGRRAGGRRSELGSLRGTERDLRERGEMGGKHRCIGGLPTARSPPRPRPRSAEGGSCAFQSPRNAKLGTGKQRGEGCKAEVAEKGWGTGREISKFCIP